MNDKEVQNKSNGSTKKEDTKDHPLNDDELGKLSGGLITDIACAICGKSLDKCHCKV